MRKSNNYNKFLEYIAFGVGSNHGDAVSTENGVLECVAEAKVEDFERYSRLFKCKYDKMTMDSNTWLKFKVVLVNEEVIELYYVVDSHETHIDTFVLDNFRTQKDVLSTVHQKVVEFFLNSEHFCKLEESTEDCNEYEEILDRKESTDRDRINYLMETHSFTSISEMYNDKCFCCPADRKSNECKGIETCGKTWKRYEAIMNPEWHHVSLATITNLDFDILDEKRQLYLSLYREVKELIKDLHKCKTGRTYEKRLAKMYSRNAELVSENKVTSDYIRYVTRKVSMCNVERGFWTSATEESTGYHKSRRYNQLTMRY